jgi:hypothetical protein
MLNIEPYNNLINHVGFAQMSLDNMLEIETVAKNEEVMRYVKHVQKNHEKIIDILTFLVVKKVEDNKQ